MNNLLDRPHQKYYRAYIYSNSDKQIKGWRSLYHSAVIIPVLSIAVPISISIYYIDFRLVVVSQKS